MESFVRNNSYICNHLLYNLVCDKLLDKKNNIKEEIKYKIQIPEFKVQNSKFIGKPEDKFETMLFLPPNKNRKAEGGLRIRGLFKFSYKLVNGVWHICDLDGNPAIPAPTELQEKINQYTSHLPPTTFLPLITVITVVYNGAKYLEDTIKSVINQTYPNVEYIIIDGGSTDGTIDIIKKYDDYIDYWVSEPDKGIYDAWNKGVTVTNGQFVSFLGSGDTYHKDALKKYCNVILENNLNCLYISSKIELKKDKNVLRIIGDKWDWKVFKKYMNVAHVGSLHSLKLFKTFGLFDINFKIAGDYEFLLRVKDKLKACFLNEITATMRIDGVSNNSMKVFFETYIAKRKHTNRNSLFLFWELIWGIIKWYIKRFIWYLKIY
jgi:hypothetical protein